LSEKPQILKWEVAIKDTLLLMPLSKQDSVGWELQRLLSIATMMTVNPIQFGHTSTVGKTLWIRKDSKIHR